MRAKDRDAKIKMRKEGVKFNKGLLRAMPVKKNVARIVAASVPRQPPQSAPPVPSADSGRPAPDTAGTEGRASRQKGGKTP